MSAIDSMSRLMFDRSIRQELLIWKRSQMQRYLDDNVNKGIQMSEHMEQWRYLLYERPLLAKNLVDNYCEDNETKCNDMLQKLAHTPGAMSLILGQVGKGKTALGLWLLEKLHSDYDQNVGMIHSTLQDNLPSYIRQGKDIFNLDPDTIWFLDEASLHANARNAMTTDNKEMGMLMNIRRHQNLSLIFASQHHSFMEINIMRGAHFFFFKELSWEEQYKKHGESSMTYMMEFIKWMMPRTNEQTLFTDGEKWTKFDTGLPSFWTDEVSKSYKKWTVEDAVDFIVESVECGMKIRAIETQLAVRGFRTLTKAEIRRASTDPDGFLSDWHSAYDNVSNKKHISFPDRKEDK